MSKKYLIIDANSVGYSAQDAPKLMIGDKEVQAIFGFIRSLRMALKNNIDYVPIVLWDGRAQWRYDLFDQYKGNRNKSDERAAEKKAYQGQIADIKRALRNLGVTQITTSDAEADDLAGHFARRLGANKSTTIKLYTGDKDWCQLVTENVTWECHKTKRVCNIANFEEFTGFPNAHMFVEAKSLTGDSSDNIPGVGGIGDKGVDELFASFCNVEEFLTAYKSGSITRKIPASWRRLAENIAPSDSKKYGAMAKAHDAFIRNMKLMNLMTDWRPDKTKTSVVVGNYDEDLFVEFCDDLMFKSILLQLDTWIAPFKRVRRKS